MILGEISVFTLLEMGWCDFFEEQVEEQDRDFIAARVAEENRGLYRILCRQGELQAELSGKMRHVTESRDGLPAVGDWVLTQTRPGEGRGTIQRVLRRKGKFSRKVAGRKTEEQIVAANVDVVFLVSSLNREFSARRMERYLTLAWDSGAKPVIVLNKADLCEDAEELRSQTEAVAMGARVVLTSATRGDGIEEMRALLRGGGEGEQSCVTAALLGSSGVGKSSLINALLGSVRLATQAVRDGDDRGRHTTTSRQLLLVPSGGVLIDTPGMRELQLWDAADGIGRTFGDIQELAASCKFRDCRHQGEPGCAVRAAVDRKILDAARVENFHKLEREERFLEAKQDTSVRSQRTKELRKLMRGVNRFYRERGH
jgi:ribosome biogenesis GTPase